MKRQSCPEWRRRYHYCRHLGANVIRGGVTRALGFDLRTLSRTQPPANLQVV